MTLNEFQNCKRDGLNGALLALWLDAHHDWAAAHEVAQAMDDEDGSWIHAYLHRKDGDLANAQYWYRRAGRPQCSTGLQEEWAAIASALLARGQGSSLK